VSNRSIEIKHKESVRVVILLIFMLFMLSVIGMSLFRIQVVNNLKYNQNLEKQSIRRVLLPGIRGRIFDRNGICLADNRPKYSIAAYLEEMRKPGSQDNTINNITNRIALLWQDLGVTNAVDVAEIKKHMRMRRPMPFVVWDGISDDLMARFKVLQDKHPGFAIIYEPVREYPQMNSAGHLLGYVGKSHPVVSEEMPFNYYSPGMIGKNGVELSFDEKLSGKAGGKLIRVDASGFYHEDENVKAPIRGNDVTLTVDMRIQKLAETALAGSRGSVVVLDVNNGDVIAMVSEPSYDPNDFSPSISRELYSEMISNPGKPFLNRAIRGTYAPGSTFKPLIGLTALINNVIDDTQEYDCPGYYQVGNVKIHCWNRYGHGKLDLRDSIEQSCNAYFCWLGLETGYDKIYHVADTLGFGKKTGIALPYESSGILPSDSWKRDRFNQGWRSGDTANISIGQGFLQVTPLQLAVMVMALANGGHVYQPRIVLEWGKPGYEVANMPWKFEDINPIREGMYQVVEAPNGSGKRAKVEGVRAAGKTGTAEYGKKSEGKKNAWMVAYVPFYAPKYAIVILVEDGASGGTTVAPKIKYMIEGLQQMDEI
jgi:penicillin-binding protein 2